MTLDELTGPWKCAAPLFQFWTLLSLGPGSQARKNGRLASEAQQKEASQLKAWACCLQAEACYYIG